MKKKIFDVWSLALALSFLLISVSPSKSANGCDLLERWRVVVSTEFPDWAMNVYPNSEIGMTVIASMYSDTNFVLFTGLPFEKMSQKDREKLWKRIRACQTKKKFSNDVIVSWIILYGLEPLGSVYAADQMAATVSEQRVKRDLYSRVLRKLSLDEKTLQDVNESRMLLATDFSLMLPSEKKRLFDLIEAVEPQLTSGQLLKDAKNLDTLQNTYSSLSVLRMFRYGYSGVYAKASSEARSTADSQITRKRNSVLDYLITGELAAAISMPPDDPKIELLNRLHSRFDSLRRVFPDYQFLERARDSIKSLKTQNLALMKDNIIQSLGAAESLTDLEKVELFYLSNANDSSTEFEQLSDQVALAKTNLIAREEAEQLAFESEVLRRQDSLGFTADGLLFEELYTDIFRGNFLDLPFDRHEMAFALLLNSYVEVYSKNCFSSLDTSSMIMLTHLECEDWRPILNGWGLEIRRECKRWVEKPTGLYASPDMYRARAAVAALQGVDAWRTVISLMKAENPFAKTIGMFSDKATLETDLVALVKLNGCEGAGLMRFQENLRLFAHHKKPIRLVADPSTTAISLNQDYDRLVDDLIFMQSQSWAVYKYQRRSVYNVIVVSRDESNRPTEIRADYKFLGWGPSEGYVRVMFFEGLPDCLYFHDVPMVCRSADRKIVLEFAKGSYEK